MTPPRTPRSVELSWFCPLCDDDYEYLGVPDPALASSFPHCRDVLMGAERAGFDNILLPSGYGLGIDNLSFAAGMAPLTSRLRMLLATRIGEMWPPQLARQLATLDQMMNGRLTINIISSDLPGAPLPSDARYQRTREGMQILRSLLNGEGVSADGSFYEFDVEPPRVRTESRRCPPFYFGGLSEHARDVAAAESDVFLMWPDTIPNLTEILNDMRARAAKYQRKLRFGYRIHLIVRETEREARAAARRLVSRLDADEGEKIRQRSLDHASLGVVRQALMRDAADDEGFVEDGLWTGVGRARSGCGAALVGDPDQVVAKIEQYIALGFDGFIFSGYPHREECELVERYVLPRIPHAPLSGH